MLRKRNQAGFPLASCPKMLAGLMLARLAIQCSDVDRIVHLIKSARVSRSINILRTVPLRMLSTISSPGMHVSKEGQWRSRPDSSRAAAPQDFSRSELSRRAYISRPTLSHWETGRTLPDAQSCWFLSEIFGTSIDELVKGMLRKWKGVVDRGLVKVGHSPACLRYLGAGVCLVAVSLPRAIW